MNHIKTAYLLPMLCIFSCCSLVVAAEEQGFPKIGFVKNDDANVRAGDNVNFETLCKLKKGDPVKIIDKRYSWFKIVLPKTACLYIKNDYVDMTEEKGIGMVNAAKVNLRAGPDTRYSILGQVSKPEKVKMVSEEGEWYRIEPPAETAGWIHSTQITFDMDLPKTAEDASLPSPQEENKNIILKAGAPAPKGNLLFSGQESR